MSRYIFDCETDGFLDQLTRVHCLVLKDVDTGFILSCHDHPQNLTEFSEDFMGAYGSIVDGLKILKDASEIIGHNIIKFDIPALQKVYPWFKPKGRITDTLVMSRMIWADLKYIDQGLAKVGKFPGGRHTGSHGLEAWGHRLGKHKGDYSKEMKAKGLDPWASWNQEMQDYCVLDVEVTEALYKRIVAKNYSQVAIDLEHEMETLCWTMEKNGFTFDVKKAGELYATLVGRKVELETKLKETIKPWWVSEGVFTPPRTVNYKRPDLGTTLVRKGTKGDLWVEQPVVETFTKDAPYSKVYLETFNPNSGHHIADRLKALYGWEPTAYSKDGQAKFAVLEEDDEEFDRGVPKTDEAVLSKLEYPEAALICEYKIIKKRIGQIAEGTAAWLRKEKNGKLHGSTTTSRAITGRCGHSNPNMAQVPGLEAPYGKDCRELFTASPGRELVDCDLSGIELRMLAHFMAKYDDGEYVKAILEGDIHTVNQKAAGLPTRGNAKIFIYGFLYGSGDAKTGSIIAPLAPDEEQKRIGKRIKKSFLDGLPALKALRTAVVEASRKRKGYIVGLDGRYHPVESEHKALNCLLQGTAGTLAKKWILTIDKNLKAAGFKDGDDYKIIAFIHDEVILDVRKGLGEQIGTICKNTATEVGEFYKLRCRIDAEYHVGQNWAQVH